MYRLPGLSHRAAEYVRDLALSEFADWNKPVGRPKALSVEQALRLALIHLRRNSTYAELGEDAGVVASTAWGYVQLMTQFIADVLGCGPEELPSVVADKICLVDGTLVPTFNWRHRRDLYSGKHRRYGVTVAVVTDLHGRIAGGGRGPPGSRHDAWCFGQDRLGERLSGAGGVVADPGYQGCGITTPIKKKPGMERCDADKEFNTRIARIRSGGQDLSRLRLAVRRGSVTCREISLLLAFGSQVPRPSRRRGIVVSWCVGWDPASCSRVQVLGSV